MEGASVATSEGGEPACGERGSGPSHADPDPLDTLVAWERLDGALGALPPDQRVALLLIDQEGYDYRTAGEIIGVPAGTGSVVQLMVAQ